MGMEWYSQGKKENNIVDPWENVTEMCDVCGKDIPVRETQRVVWYSPTGTRFVIRKHPSCDPTQIIKYLS